MTIPLCEWLFSLNTHVVMHVKSPLPIKAVQFSTISIGCLPGSCDNTWIASILGCCDQCCYEWGQCGKQLVETQVDTWKQDNWSVQKLCKSAERPHTFPGSYTTPPFFPFHYVSLCILTCEVNEHLAFALVSGHVDSPLGGHYYQTQHCSPLAPQNISMLQQCNLGWVWNF